MNGRSPRFFVLVAALAGSSFIECDDPVVPILSRRAAAGRAGLRALTQAALLAEFQKSSKLPPCGTARQRGRGVFDGAAAWAWGFWTLRKSEKNSSKFSKIQQNSAKFRQICEILEKKQAKNSAIFNENFEIRERFQSGAKECIV